MKSISTPLLKNASLVLGPPIIGVTLNWFLYGIFVVQYIMYLNNSSRDRKLLRAIVHFLFLLDTAQTLMTMDDIFFWFVYNFGNLPALLRFNIAGVDGPILDAIITFTAQLVYCWRLWVIGGWRIIPIAAAFLALVASVGGITAGIHTVLSPTHLRVAEYIWLFASAVTDIVIASSMTYLLLKHGKNTTSRTTMALAKRILFLTLETNALTAAVAIAFTACLLVPSISPPNTNVYITFGYILGKMYSNCFMVLLNQRAYYDSHGRFCETHNLNHSWRGTASFGRDYLPSAGQISTLQFSNATDTEVSHSTMEVGGIRGAKDYKSVPHGLV